MHDANCQFIFWTRRQTPDWTHQNTHKNGKCSRNSTSFRIKCVCAKIMAGSGNSWASLELHTTLSHAKSDSKTLEKTRLEFSKTKRDKIAYFHGPCFCIETNQGVSQKILLEAWRQWNIYICIESQTMINYFSYSSGSNCTICNKRINHRIGRKSYTCRDCGLVCHKACHTKTDVVCPETSVNSMEL